MQLSIIIVNYNTFAVTSQCIASVYRHVEGISFEIILIDNNSSDTPADKFKELFPTIVLHKATENLGFGKANNLGMTIAKGKYFLLLNSDTIVRSACIQQCVAFMETDKARRNNIGLLGCKLLNEDGSYQPSVFPYLSNSLWTYFITTNPLANRILNWLKKDKHQNFDPSCEQYVGDISGAFMLFRREVAINTGMFDTDFFMYCEDTEWCRERINKQTNILYYPHESIVHLGGRSAPVSLMFIQSKLSLSLVWYKKGWLNYLGYIVLSYLNCLTILITLPLYTPSVKASQKLYIKTYRAIFKQLFTDIPRYPRRLNTRKTKLVYSGARKVMSIKD